MANPTCATMLGMTAYQPSQQLTDALASFEQAQRALDAARENLRAAVAHDLKTSDITNEVIAEHLPWSAETVRGIAREYDVPRKRKPTVRSIKPRKRAASSP